MNSPRRTSRTRALILLGVAIAMLASSLAIGEAAADTTSYRVNSGGAQLAGTPVWTADTTASPTPYLTTGGDKTLTTAAAINVSDPSLPAGTPAALFQSERYDTARAPRMVYTFPTTPGTYMVRLYFAETYAPTGVVGGRVFDVNLEGATVLDDFDIFAAAGSINKGIARTFTITADNDVDLEFVNGVQNPTVNGIEIISVDGALPDPTLNASSSSLAFNPTAVGSTAQLPVTLSHGGPSNAGPLTITGTAISGASSTQFTDSFNDAVPLVLNPGQSTVVNVTYTPSAAGAATATLAITHDGVNSPLSISLSGVGTGLIDPGPLYRVNVGGPAVADTVAWAPDTVANPSLFRTSGGEKTLSNNATINTSDASLPAGTPAALFADERYDPSKSPRMTWAFPTTPGTYQVRLYFAETYAPLGSVGARVFDATLEGATVLDDYDIFADAGAINRGVSKVFTVAADDDIDLQFINGIENPKFDAIEIRAVSAAPAPILDSDPETVTFAATSIGQTSTIPVTFTNTGASNSGPLNITSTAIVGGSAAAFSDNFTDGTPVSLAPGQSTTVNVSFTPTSAGAAAASLSVTHTGVSSPFVLPLNGATPNASTLQASPSDLTFSSIAAGTTSTADVTFTNLGTAGSPSIQLNSTLIIGAQSAWFSDSFTDGTPVTIAPGASRTVTVTFAPVAAGSASATLQLSHTGLNSPTTVSLSGSATGAAGTAPLYRINSGGPAIAGTPAWSADPSATPSTYLTTGGQKVATTGVATNMTDPSVPAGTPAALFLDERYDPSKAPQMTWTFPTTPGTYEVRLYFAETYALNAVIGARVFDVNIEGATVLDDFDIFKAAGAANKAVVKSFTVTADNDIDLGFVNGVENPTINAIEILPATATAPTPTLAASPASIAFPATTVGQTVTQAVTLTNTGAAAAGPLEITGSTITGTNAGQFTDNFPDATPVTLAPGQTRTVNVTFTRTTTGPVSAAVNFAHTGSGGSLSVPLSSAVPTLSATPSAVSFPSTVIGNTATAQVTLTNSGVAGSGSISIVQSTLSGAAADQFGDSFSDGNTVVLAPGQTTLVDVTYSPAAPGAATATVTFSHNGSGGSLAVPLSGSGVEAGGSGQISFGKSTIAGLMNGAGPRPTSMVWGPDGRLYVSTLTGAIYVATIVRNGPNSYTATNVETINTLKTIANHDDNGVLNPTQTNRMVIGLDVGGTAANPVIYAVSSDPRIGSPATGDLGMDTNSGILSRLRWSGTSWVHTQLVRGLPRSKEQHSVESVVLDEGANKVYLMSGGQTNHGAPSANFQYTPEYALTAAILTADLTALGNSTYDIPTLDDEDRPGVNDANDPFGGNQGKNQAKLVPGGPIQLYATGFRNAYDAVITSTGLYAIDNGGNYGWGGQPALEGPGGNCTNAVDNTGITLNDGLHRMTGPGYYGGHPNPTRGNISNTFNASNPQSPVVAEDPIECDFRLASERGALASFPTSTNGITQFSTGNFGGALSGDLLAAGWDNTIYRIDLNASGTTATASALFNNVGGFPLDVIASNSTDPFPGTILTADYGARYVYIYEPADYDGAVAVCHGTNSPSLDEDGDGFDNADEIANGTNPCSAGDIPTDNDGDFDSDLHDTDDDNDGTLDINDPFAIDAQNGLGTPIPLDLPWDSDTPLAGGILGLGLTGAMTNGVNDWKSIYDINNMTVIGAAGVVTIDAVPNGDALGAANNQQYGLHVGVDARPTSTGPFELTSLLPSPYAAGTPLAGQSFGIRFGPGDQDNYVKIVLAGANGGEIQVVREVNGVATTIGTASVPVPGPVNVSVFLQVNPATGSVQAFRRTNSDGAKVAVGPAFTVPTSWFANSGLAVGLIATSGGAASPLTASWDNLAVHSLS